ncbi:VTT domain-containing protein [Streptomyces sp. NPDC093260]|uniref:DedA family protein n=1 Tax=Streptomyces sp. NPDC093260 TaxID=3155073 RepID=UPI00344031BD
MTTLALGPSWLDPNYLLDTFGIWGLLLVVFAESGLLIGFFLPGDSLLFTCGLLITSNQLDFPLWAAIALICLAAVLGDQAGYMFGKKVGPSLFSRPDSRLFKQENVTKAHEFFEQYGPKSLVLARFVPIVRTFTPIIAGVSGMKYRSFLVFNLIGGILWGAGVTLLGSWLGNIAFVKENIEAILILVVLVSVVPIGIEFLRARSKAKKNPQPAVRDEEPAFAQQSPYPRAPYAGQADGQQAYGQPVADDATTQLRRIDPGPQSAPRQQPRPRPYGDGNPPQGQQQYGDRNAPQGQQQYGEQYPQQQNQHHGEQYPQQQNQHHGEQYGQQQHQPHQQPYGHQPQQQPYPPRHQQQPYANQPYAGQQSYGDRQGEYDPNPDRNQQDPRDQGYYRAP